MNGIEVCERLNEKIDIIKILLTGEYQPLEALTAINKRKADNYISKGKPNTFTELITTVQELQLKYFITLTQNYSTVLNNKFKFLFDCEFAELFNTLKDKNNFIEYYLLNNTGSFLMKSPSSKLLLNVYTDEDLDTFCEMYNYLDNSIISEIKARNIIPNFKIPNKPDVKNLFYPAEKTGKYYYNLTEINDFNNSIGL